MSDEQKPKPRYYIANVGWTHQDSLDDVKPVPQVSFYDGEVPSDEEIERAKTPIFVDGNAIPTEVTITFETSLSQDDYLQLYRVLRGMKRPDKLN